MPPITITFTSFKGGVGKTTSSVSLCCLLSQYGETLLIDSDPNRSASVWAFPLGDETTYLPFTVCTDKTVARVIGTRPFKFVVFDTPGRPSESEIRELARGCDLLILPATPDTLAIDALNLTLGALPKATNFQVLLTMIPPPPQKDGKEALTALREMGLPVLGDGIRLFKVYKDAAAAGVPVYKLRGGKIAWRDWTKLLDLEPIKQLIAKADSQAS